MITTLNIVFLCLALSCQSISHNQIFRSKTETVSLRLHPNQDIMESLTTALIKNQFQALSVATAVGSVRSCWIRFANNSYLSFLDGPFEITSLVGTFDKNLEPHIHIQLTDGLGKSFGGHLPSLNERGYAESIQTGSAHNKLFACPIFTTLEIVFLHHVDLIYERRIDPQTTFHELYISKRRWH